MNNSNLVQRRLHNHKLSSSNLKLPADVVRWLGAVQAQDFNAARWAVGLRMRNATSAAAIDDAFNDGQILRTHLLRPTWHFVTPEDIRWLLELTAPRVNLRSGPNYRKYELDAPTFKRSNKILTNALKGGQHLTRSDLKAALNRSGVAADDVVRLAHILLRAELDGVVCSGRRVGKQFTYALLDERVPPAKTMTRDESLATLTQRYFRSHGPATVDDFVWWSGLRAADIREGLVLLAGEIEKEIINGIAYYSAPLRATPQASTPELSAHLLPAYDEYNVAYKDRHVMLDACDGIITWDMLGPTISINGRITGTWKATINKTALTVSLHMARKLKKPETLAVSKAADQFAKFLNLSDVIIQ